MKNAHIALLVSIFFIVQVMTPLAEFTELKEHNPSNVAAQSSWVWDVNVGIEGGAVGVDVSPLGNAYALTLTHAGEGTVGNHTWANEAAGGKLIVIDHDGGVWSSAQSDLCPLEWDLGSLQRPFGDNESCPFTPRSS